MREDRPHPQWKKRVAPWRIFSCSGCPEQTHFTQFQKLIICPEMIQPSLVDLALMSSTVHLRPSLSSYSHLATNVLKKRPGKASSGTVDIHWAGSFADYFCFDAACSACLKPPLHVSPHHTTLLQSPSCTVYCFLGAFSCPWGKLFRSCFDCIFPPYTHTSSHHSLVTRISIVENPVIVSLGPLHTHTHPKSAVSITMLWTEIEARCWAPGRLSFSSTLNI